MDRVPFVSRTLHVVLGSVEVDKILQFARYGTGDDRGSGKVALFRDTLLVCSLFAGDKLVPFRALELVIGDVVMKTIHTKDSVNPITPFLEIVHVQLFHRAVVILVCGHHRKIKGGAVDS